MDALRRVFRALRLTARAAESRTRLSSAQLLVLRTVGAAPGCSLSDLADATLTDPSSVSVVTARLLGQGLLRRRPAPDDRRRATLNLTAAGRERLRRAPEPAQERLFAGLLGLAPARLRALARGLASVEASMGLSSAQPALLFDEERARRRPR